MWFALGEELAFDSAKLMAQRAISQGVKVIWKEFEALPHGFIALPFLSSMKQSDMCFESWADFCRKCSEDPRSINSSSTMIRFKDGKEEDILLQKEGDLTFKQAEEMMKISMVRKDAWFKRMLLRQSKI